MPSRCGCSQSCACVLNTDASLALSGNGSIQSPWLLRVVPDCNVTMACVSTRVDVPLAVSNGRLGVRISTNANQALTLGTDGGLYVPTASSGGVVAANTSTVALAGAGQVGNPLSATWLGTSTNNSPPTGVDLLGNGTPGTPLRAQWGGVTLASSNPEMVLSGNGTPSSPLGIAADGMAWIRFQLGNLIINNGSIGIPVPWSADIGHGNAVFTRTGPSNQHLLCQRAGAYLMVMRLRGQLTASATTSGGYFQVHFDQIGTSGTTTPAIDFVHNTYGASWVDIYAQHVLLFSVGDEYTVTLDNRTGSNCTAGTIYWTFLRIGP